MPRIEKLFSYGTLRYASVQRSTFGRTLSGAADALLGYRLTTITIEDAHVLALSHETQHPLLHPSDNPLDRVEGMVFDVTPEELAAADSYEVDAYRRVAVTLESGIEAWAYVSANG
jgi:gamma-glutamylcyclotransferase (GGCT)/AIG2-like uncharacterized protein YtfP